MRAHVCMAPAVRSEKGARYVRDEDLPPDCAHEMHEFVARMVERRMIPCPGDVDVLSGGPPCQGVRLRGGRRSPGPLRPLAAAAGGQPLPS
jgi:hypothetical protein